jgi:hypothetical protein
LLNSPYDIPWQQDDIRVFGKNSSATSLTALFGNREYYDATHPWNLLLQS